jgi:hypothetical protein
MHVIGGNMDEHRTHPHRSISIAIRAWLIDAIGLPQGFGAAI